MRAPSISVLMPVYNAQRYVLHSVNSVLAQTDDDFELLAINDGSTDRTLEILSAISDPRLRILNNPRNLGIVETLNRGMLESVGTYIARADADDICLPTRFAKQRKFLDENPSVLLVGTELSVLSRGRINLKEHEEVPADLLKFMFNVSNPIGHPSMMFRAEPVRGNVYLREEFKYAEDFDFSHRMMEIGEVRLLPENLVMYRQHGSNVTLLRRQEMENRTALVLKRVYLDLFGQPFDREADLVAAHMVSGAPCCDRDSFIRLGMFLNNLIKRWSEIYDTDNHQINRITDFTGRLWWRAIQATLRAGHRRVCADSYDAFWWSKPTQPKHRYLARSLAAGILPYRPTEATPVSAPPKKFISEGLKFKETSDDDQPPTMYVVIDTEAEFDWTKDFNRAHTDVSSMSHQFLAQTIFDEYGARPVYLVDYAVASQKEGYQPLQEIFNRRGCAIGAHLHSWVNPPFEENVSDRTSYECNLPVDLEERKLVVLQEMIKSTFGISPLFFKAGRYGVGAQTIKLLQRLGFAVDFSILPFDDLRSVGGMDFRFAEACPYQVGDIVSVPMTRGQIGLLSPLSPQWHSRVRAPLPLRMHLPGVLSWLHLANTVTLTPEGVPADEQIRLIRSMVARGSRTFVLHYHSPSLAGLTPYVGNHHEVSKFLENLRTVCSYFFDTMGGLPGNPADLVPSSMRDKVFA